MHVICRFVKEAIHCGHMLERPKASDIFILKITVVLVLVSFFSNYFYII